MARKRIPALVEDDGLDQLWVVDQNTPLEEYPPDLVRVLAAFKGFTSWAEQLKQHWGPIAQAHPVTLRRRAHGFTQAAYAYRVLGYVKFLERVLRTRPEIEQGIIMQAVRLGYDWADARWRFNRGRLTRTGAQRVQGYADSGRKSGAARRDKTHPAIIDMAHELRRIHPYSRRQYSTRWLASRIAKALKRPVGTVRAALRTHQIT